MKRPLFILCILILGKSFSQLPPAFFSGMINGKYKIVLQLKDEGDDIASGAYLYESQYKLIYLKGASLDSDFSLQALDENGKETGEKFEGTLSKGVFSGLWYKDDASEGVPFSLKQNSWVSSSAELSGTYTIGTSKKEIAEQNLPEYETGYTGKVTIQSYVGKLGFCLNYNSGYPSYHIGNINGIAIPTKNPDEYKFKQAVSDPKLPCEIIFRFKNGILEIEQNTEDHTCGFGAGVDISGVYSRLSGKTEMAVCFN